MIFGDDVTKWAVRKCGARWYIWKPFHGVADYRADSFADLIAGRPGQISLPRRRFGHLSIHRRTPRQMFEMLSAGLALSAAPAAPLIGSELVRRQA